MCQNYPAQPNTLNKTADEGISTTALREHRQWWRRVTLRLRRDNQDRCSVILSYTVNLRPIHRIVFTSVPTFQ